jgi:hypothetical protein
VICQRKLRSLRAAVTRMGYRTKRYCQSQRIQPCHSKAGYPCGDNGQRAVDVVTHVLCDSCVGLHSCTHRGHASHNRDADIIRISAVPCIIRMLYMLYQPQNPGKRAAKSPGFGDATVLPSARLCRSVQAVCPTLVRGNSHFVTSQGNIYIGCLYRGPQ